MFFLPALLSSYVSLSIHLTRSLSSLPLVLPIFASHLSSSCILTILEPYFLILIPLLPNPPFFLLPRLFIVAVLSFPCLPLSSPSFTSQSLLDFSVPCLTFLPLFASSYLSCSFFAFTITYFPSLPYHSLLPGFPLCQSPVSDLPSSSSHSPLPGLFLRGHLEPIMFLSSPRAN